MRYPGLIPLILVFCLAGCSDDEDNPVVGVTPDGSPNQIVIMGGDGQSGNPETPTDDPLMVRVLSAQDLPVENVTVFFSTTDPHIVIDGTKLTDANGVAFTWVRFGDRAGSFSVEADVPGVENSPAVFTLSTTGDVSSVESKEIGRLDIPVSLVNVGSIYGEYLHEFTMVGDLAFIPIGTYGNGARVVNLQNRSEPILATALSGFSTRDFAADGGVLCSVGGNNLNTLDISNPLAPILMGELDLRASSGGAAAAVAVKGNVAFVAGGGPSLGSANSLYSFDVSDLSNPVPGVGAASTGGADIVLRENLAYVAAYDNGLYIFDISTPLINLPLAGGAGSGGTATKVVLEGDFAYLLNPGDPTATVGVVDISDPQAPSLVTVVTIPELWHGSNYGYGHSFYGMAVDGNRLMVGGNRGVVVMDTSDPVAPVPLGRVDPRSYIGGIAYLGEGQWGVVDYHGLAVIEVGSIPLDAP